MSVPLLSLFYGFGEYIEVWDRISGRQAATDAYFRLQTGTGYPKILIYRDEPEFEPLLKLILKYSKMADAAAYQKEGHKPTAITRAFLDKTPPTAMYQPDTSYIAVFFDMPSKEVTMGSVVKNVGTIPELLQWIERSRNTEHFLVNILLISLLSIFVAWYEIRKDKTQRYASPYGSSATGSPPGEA